MAKKGSFRFCIIFVTSLMAMASAQVPMDVSPPPSIDFQPPGGQSRTIPILVTNNTGISAFTMTLTYPTSLLSFVQLSTTGTGTEDWTSASGQENSPGQVTILAFEGSGTTFTDDDTLINVIFTDSASPGLGQITLSGFDDDIINATTSALAGMINSNVPVELVSFSAQLGTGEVSLAWTTASEDNNFGFDIEKSFDKESFSKIGFVRGQGTTTVLQRYTFSDTKLDSDQPVRYYRLKQIDLDGAFTHSGVLEVNLIAPDNFTLKQNYPNPFNPETTITYELPEATKVTLVIYNLKGELIRTLLDEERPAGVHNIVWNGKDHSVRDVASGMYLYQMRAGDVVHVRMLTLLR